MGGGIALARLQLLVYALDNNNTRCMIQYMQCNTCACPLQYVYAFICIYSNIGDLLEGGLERGPLLGLRVPPRKFLHNPDVGSPWTLR